MGGSLITMPTVFSVTVAVGATQLVKYKTIVTRITESAIEELAGVTILLLREVTRRERSPPTSLQSMAIMSRHTAH